MRWHTFLLLAVSFTATATAQQKRPAAPKPPVATNQPSAAPTKFPIETLRVTGNKKFTAEKILAASGLKVRQLVAKEDFDVARTRLLSTGAFESVGYDFNPSKAGSGFDVTLEVSEVTPLFRYRFEDLPASDDALRAALRQQEPLFGDEIPATRPVIERYEKTLRQFLQSKVEIEGALNSELPGEPAILFRPPGKRPRVSEIHFTGNDVIPSEQVAKTFSDVAIGAAFTPANMRLLLDSSVRPLYEARGRIRVAFPAIQAEKSAEQDVDGVSVTVTVAEGEPYNLGAVKLAGVQKDKTDELQKLANWKTKDLANFDEINAGIARIVKRYRSEGYLHAAAKTDRAIDDQEHAVDLLVTIDQGPQFKYGKLDIRGLDLNSEPAIRKMWGDRAGKPFDPEFPAAFLKDVREQGIFDNLGETTPATKVNEDSKTADVTLTFMGAPAPGPQRQRLGQRP